MLNILDKTGIARQSAILPSVNVSGTLNNCDVIAFQGAAGGSVAITINVSYIQWLGSHDRENWFPIYVSGAQVTSTVTNQTIVPIPDACFGLPFLKIQTDADGTLSVCLKG